MASPVAAVISNVAADAAAGVGGKLVESAASVRFSEPKVKPTGVKVLATSPKPIKPKLTAANPHSSSISSLPPNLKPTKTNIPSVGAGVSAAQLGVTGSSSNIGGPTRKVRIIAVRGSGFVIRRKGPLRKKDIPDVYLKIKVGTEKKWQTSVIKNSIKPEWNESKIFDLSNVNATSLLVEAWDKNKGKLDKDDCYGHAMTRVGKVLLSGGTANLELLGGKSETEATGLFITIFCSLER
uniref:C2 domain-containing protein n=1 Tax=Craspedostauros australis TaxID=1486917 RepID=A0A7R9WXL5_9STRA